MKTNENCQEKACKFWDKNADEHCAAKTIEIMDSVDCPWMKRLDRIADEITARSKYSLFSSAVVNGILEKMSEKSEQEKKR